MKRSLSYLCWIWYKFQKRQRSSNCCSSSTTSLHLLTGKRQRQGPGDRKLPTSTSLSAQPVALGVLLDRRPVRPRQEQGLHVRAVHRRDDEPVRAGELFVQPISARISPARADRVRQEDRQFCHGLVSPSAGKLSVSGTRLMVQSLMKTVFTSTGLLPISCSLICSSCASGSDPIKKISSLNLWYLGLACGQVVRVLAFYSD